MEKKSLNSIKNRVYRIEGNIIDHHHKEIFEGSIEIEGKHIKAIHRHPTCSASYIMAGLVNAHVHLESSMLMPQEFGKLSIAHGTIATVSDPHEIANVMGTEGIEYLMQHAESSPIKHFFTIPSCVPASPFDSNGATIDSDEVEQLARSGRFVALSEVMNIPGVIHKDPEVIAKLAVAKANHLPIDGHAPLLSGEPLQQYAAASITTDHESCDLQIAKEKLSNGIKIILRQGSAAKNYPSLHPLIASHTDQLMFCTDDSHPDDLLHHGEIDLILRKALTDGYSIFDLLKIASSNPINHYKLNVGQLRPGDLADFIVIDNLEALHTKQVYIEGELCYDSRQAGEQAPPESQPIIPINRFDHAPIQPQCLAFPTDGTELLMIGLISNQIITQKRSFTPHTTHNFESDLTQDILKIVYLNRYTDSEPQVAFCQGMGLKRGALASSIAHDSHNIIAIGCSDQAITEAINELIAHRGALVVHDGHKVHSLPLPIGGIISDQPATEVIRRYEHLQRLTNLIGSPLQSPFMTLSFLALVVIPHLKIGEQGLFDYNLFDWVEKKPLN